jgi:predicted transcriptional regulator
MITVGMRIEDGIKMHLNRRMLVVLLLSLLFLFFLAETAAAEPLKPDFTTIGISIVVVIAAIVTIITVITVGGIKYVTPENVLDTEVRKNLYEYIDEYPGSHLREIARELDLKPSNAAWHLRKLEQTNLVRSRVIGGKRVYYIVDGGIVARREAIAESVLRNKNARMIMQYLSDNPGKHLLEIAHALDLNHHTVKWHIRKMYMAELIEGDTTSSVYPVYYPTEIGHHALEHVSEHFKKPGRAS